MTNPPWNSGAPGQHGQGGGQGQFGNQGGQQPPQGSWGGQQQGGPHAPTAQFPQVGQGSFGTAGTPGYGTPASGAGGQSYGPGAGSPGQTGHAPGYGAPSPQGSGGYPGRAGGYGTPAGPGQVFGQQNPYGQPTSTAPAFAGLHVGAGAAPTPTRKRGPGLFIALGAGALVLLLVLGGVIGEFVTRGNVTGDLAQRAENAKIGFADTTFSGGYDVRIDGFSVLAQVLGGKFDRVALDGRDLKAHDAPVDLNWTVTGMPTDHSAPSDSIHTELSYSVDALTAAVTAALEASDSDKKWDYSVSPASGNSMEVSVSAKGGKAGITYRVEYAVQDGKLMMTFRDQNLVFDSTKIPLGDSDPVEVEVCKDVEEVEVKVTDATISKEGATFGWTVTGGGARVDRLESIGNCLSLTPDALKD